MIFSPRSRPNVSALLAIAVLHAALFSALLARRHHTAPYEGKPLEPILWLLPLAVKPAPGKAAPHPAPAAQPQRPTPPRPLPQRPRSDLPAAPAATEAPPAAPLPAPPAPVSASTSASDPFTLGSPSPAPARANDAPLGRKDWGAGKADHELRGGKLARMVRPTDTFQAGLERAFRDAGEAVPPKWYERADIREMSVPEGRMRMYKIRTAMGTYCFYKPDPSLQATYEYKLMTCPREK